MRSACAVLVASQNQNREWLYSQQQTVSAEGFSGHAFSTYVPHTVRTRETKKCTDCHLSEANDNNAIMAQLVLQGTNYTNFMGRFCYVGCGEAGFYAVVVTEREEPQAVYGSTLHRDAFPKRYEKFVNEGGRTLTESYHHGGTDTRSIQLRGEYLYAAEGPGGFYAYDVANVDNKGFSERITTSIVSPLGQKLFWKSKFVTGMASPSTLAVDPTRPHRPENEEQSIHPMYAFLYVTDRYDGLIMTVAATLLDGDPANNFMKPDVVFNPDGILDGAENITVAGTWAYIGCKAGLVILDLADITLTNPTPRVARVIGPDKLGGVTSVTVQFRYAFVTDAGTQGRGHHRSREGDGRSRCEDPAEGGERCVGVADVRVRFRGIAGPGDRGRGEPGKAEDRSDLRRRRPDERRAPVPRGDDEHLALRLRGRRQERPACPAAHLTRDRPRLRGLQPPRLAATDRHVPHARPGQGAQPAAGARPRGGRERQPARGLRPCRRAPLQRPGAQPPLHPRRQALPRHRRACDRAY